MATSDPIARFRAYYLYLSQGDTWFPDAKPAVAITDMDPAWRHNAAAFLVRRARGYLSLYTYGEILYVFGGTAREVIGEDSGEPVYGRTVSTGPTPGSMAEEWLERGLEDARADRDADPEAWIKTTALYKALVAGLPKGKRKRKALAEVARHWSTCRARTTKGGACTCAAIRDAHRQAAMDDHHERLAAAEVTAP